MTYIVPFLGTCYFSRYPSVALARNISRLIGASPVVLIYTSSPPQEKLFFATFCQAKIDPPVTKIRLWTFFGV